MKISTLVRAQLGAALILAGGALSSAQAKTPVFGTFNADSDILGVANYTDLNVTNPWGLTTGTAGNLHIADNAAGVATEEAPSGAPIGGSGSNFIIIPAAAASGTLPGVPTGVDENLHGILDTSDTNDFAISSGTLTLSSHYLYCTEDGAIAGYRAEVNKASAIIGVDLSGSGAGYTGIALSWATSGTGSAKSHELYAANFAQGRIDVFNSQFQQITPTVANPFVDPNPPAITATNAGVSWSPFNIHRLDYKNGKETARRLLVAYALHTAGSLDDVSGAGNGYVAMYTPEGQFVTDLIAPSGNHPNGNWALNSPWGIAISHSAIASFKSPIVILIGNHGNGTINAFTFFPKLAVNVGVDGAHLGTLQDDHSDSLAFGNLWALHFGPKKITLKEYIADDEADLGEEAKNLYFSAGIVGEQRGLVGRILLP